MSKHPKHTKLHYKYKLFLELGLDPYRPPKKITKSYLTWQDVCHAIFINLGQQLDQNDEHIRHCGKWFVTNHGRGKIIQIIDFYEYDYEKNQNETNEIKHQLKQTIDSAISCIIV